MKVKIFLPFIIASLTACATQQKSRIATTAIGFGAGAGIGLASVPEGERKEMHSVYWGSLLGMAMGLAGNYYFNEEKDLELMKVENDKLKAQIETHEKMIFIQTKIGPAPKSTYSDSKEQVQYNIYKMDDFIDYSPTRRYHCDELYEMIPLQKGKNEK